MSDYDSDEHGVDSYVTKNYTELRAVFCKALLQSIRRKIRKEIVVDRDREFPSQSYQSGLKKALSLIKDAVKGI